MFVFNTMSVFWTRKKNINEFITNFMFNERIHNIKFSKQKLVFQNKSLAKNYFIVKCNFTMNLCDRKKNNKQIFNRKYVRLNV